MSQYPAPPPGAPDPYGPGYGQPPAQEKKGMAIAALVLGILSLPAIFTLFGGVVFGLVAVILGIVALVGANKGRNGGKGLAIGGIVLGAIGLLVSGVILAVAGTIFFGEDGQNFRDCVSDAGTDQAAVDRCSEQFEDDLTN